MDWNYIWAAIAVNFLIVFIVPRIIKKPTGIQAIDDIVLYLNSQKGFLISSSFVVALTVYLSQKWVESGSESLPSSPEKY
jgi:hypothetical protein